MAPTIFHVPSYDVSIDRTYHSVVLELRLAERGSVAGNDDELGLAIAERLEGALVAKSDLARLHDQSQTAVDRVGIALSFLGWDPLAMASRFSSKYLTGHRCV